jgi:GrpB-like predicted nucleotidyltransferase (UPF0157 family)/ribosomal protein S18 acetylase RimI-like enzyme
MPVNIRRATEADVDAIAEAHVDSILTLGPSAYDPAIVTAWGAPRSGERYLKAMQRGEAFFVAVERNAVLGFSSHRIEGDRHRAAIYVRGTATRQRIGSRLLDCAIDAAWSQGAVDVWVDASLLAVQFYRQNGFSDLGRGTHRLPGGLEMQCVYMKRDLGVAERVELTPYDPAWTQQYEHEAEPIRRALGSYEGFTIEHIGSTAIPGMPSKPIIDIVVGVGDITSIPRPTDEFWQQLGYEWGHETDQPDEWLYFIKRDTKRARISQLHVVRAHSTFFKRIVHFRNTLRADPQAAEQYSSLKAFLALAYRDERLKYRDGKSEFVEHIDRTRPSSDE